MFYNIVRTTLRIFLKIFTKIKVTNKEKIPLTGQVVVVSNHLSLWDPVVLGAFFERKIHFIAKEELFKVFLLGKIMRGVEAIPIKRGQADRNAIRKALNYLKEEEAVFIFPEGTRSKTGDLGDFLPGTSLIAVKGNAKIVPIGIKGTKNILKSLRPNIEINIGEPIDVTNLQGKKVSSEEISQLTKKIEDKVKDLLK